MRMFKTAAAALVFSLLAALMILCAPAAGAQETHTIQNYEWGGAYAMVLPTATDTTEGFSDDHPAIDLTADAGSAVLSADDGTVTLIQTADAPLTELSAAYGNMVRISHEDGNQTLYAHLDTILVAEGDTVSRGQQIGTVGMTGDANEPMLHFEVIEPLSNADPEPYISDKTDRTQATLSSIKKDLAGGTKYISDYGTIDRAALLAELQAHEHDKYYLNTPYHGGDWQSPTGDTSYNGKAGMNCAGFIAYVLRKCGLDTDAVTDAITATRYFDWSSGLPHSILSGASNYYLWAKNGDLICYAYDSMADLCAGGKAVKGDLILYYVNQGWLLSGIEDNHLVFFWGDTADDDLVWHQADIGITDEQGNTTNQIIHSTYYIKTAKYILIKMDETGYNIPEAPVVIGANRTDGKIKLSWDAVEDAVSYQIYRRDSKSGSFFKLSTRTGTSYENITLTLGKTYEYKVRAVTADGTVSNFSNIVSCTCRLARPTVTASNITSTGKIKLTWDAIEGADHYEIYRATSLDGTYYKMTPTTGTSYTNVSITPGKKYYYKVRAVAEDGTTSAYRYVARTCKLAQPKVTISNIASSGKIMLSWNKIEGATQYQVYRSTSRNGTYYKMTPTANTTYTNVSIDAGTRYYYKVEALNGNSAAASAQSSVVSAVCKLKSPTVSVKLNSNNVPVVSWKAVSEAVQYEVYRAASLNGSYYLLNPTSSLSYTNPSAKSGKTYYYKVRAVHSDSAASSKLSEAAAVTIP